MMKKIKKKELKERKKFNVALSGAYFFTFVLASSLIVMLCAVLNTKYLLKTKQIALIRAVQAQEVIDSSGAVINPPTQSQLSQYVMHNALFDELPVVGNGFVIDYDWTTDRFRVLIFEPHETGLNNFYLWKLSNYDALDLARFVISDFTAPHNGPILISVYPAVFTEGETVNFTNLVFDNNGASSIETVYFGVNGCSETTVKMGDNSFTGNFANFLGAYINSDGSGGVANQNESDNCSESSLSGSPWTEFPDSDRIDLANAPETATLVSVQKSSQNQILRLDWEVAIGNSFLDSGVFENLGYYFLATDNSGTWNEGSSSGTWTRMGAFAMKSGEIKALDEKYGVIDAAQAGGASIIKLLQGSCPQEGSIDSAIGCISYLDINRIAGFVIGWAVGIAGGLALILIVYAAFMIMTSLGKPQRVQAGKELLTSAIVGLLMALFSAYILRVAGVDILGIF